MSRFYLTMDANTYAANKPLVTRRCHNHGEVTAASFDGAIRTHVYVDGDGRSCARVTRIPRENSGGSTIVLYDGPLDLSDGDYPSNT